MLDAYAININRMTSTSQLIEKEAVVESTARELVAAGAVQSLVVLAVRGGGFAVRMSYGLSDPPMEKVLVTSRRSIRRFASIDTAAQFVRDLGCARFSVDMTDYEPGPVRPPRPDRAEALKKTRTKPQQASLLI